MQRLHINLNKTPMARIHNRLLADPTAIFSFQHFLHLFSLDFVGEVGHSLFCTLESFIVISVNIFMKNINKRMLKQKNVDKNEDIKDK
uniref:Uncharacterized protein n=1 Tax=Romanomermis culicivorax TaxID=13658 RepID=A0A915HRV4_ROMCU